MTTEFEKQFPSLKGKIYYCTQGCWGDQNFEFKEEDINSDSMRVTLKDIQENCLDKQKVKDAFDKQEENCIENDCDAIICIRELKKELGL